MAPPVQPVEVEQPKVDDLPEHHVQHVQHPPSPPPAPAFQSQLLFAPPLQPYFQPAPPMPMMGSIPPMGVPMMGSMPPMTGSQFPMGF